jgi:hypothetical protein
VKKNNEVDLAVHVTNGLPTFFSVVTPSVHPLDAILIRKNAGRMGKIETPLGEAATAFRFVPLKYHMGGNAVQFTKLATK